MPRVSVIFHYIHQEKKNLVYFDHAVFHKTIQLIVPMVGHVSKHSHTGCSICVDVRESNVCVYSNSRNDVLRVAQRYGTIAAHIRRRASVLVVFVVLCVHMHSFAGLIRRTPPPKFSDTAVTDRHSDTTIFQPRAHWARISWSIGSEKSFEHVPSVGVEPSTSCVQGEHPIH